MAETYSLASTMFAQNPRLTVDELCATDCFLAKFPSRFNMETERRREAARCIRALQQAARVRRIYDLRSELNVNNLAWALANPDPTSHRAAFIQAVVDADALDCMPTERLPLFRVAYQMRAIEAAQVLVRYFDPDDLCTAMSEILRLYEACLRRQGPLPDTYESLTEIKDKYTEGEQGDIAQVVDILRMVDSTMRSRGIHHPDPMVARPQHGRAQTHIQPASEVGFAV